MKLSKEQAVALLNFKRIATINKPIYQIAAKSAFNMFRSVLNSTETNKVYKSWQESLRYVSERQRFNKVMKELLEKLYV